MKGRQGVEVVDSLDSLATKEEMHDDVSTAYRMRCMFGMKSVCGGCVEAGKAVTVALEDKLGLAVTRLRDAVRGGHL